MRFYVPEWDDRVDANYDFLHDEHSTLGTDERDLAYIWDLFDRKNTPIDGVLISREQAEESSTKAQRLTENGIYDASKLDLPRWLPTISDCGAWGYKSLPFPPYDNGEMLEFYEQLGVTTGVTIDHLVLGAGHTARLYLNERAFSGDFSKGDIPEEVTEELDVMIDTWPNGDGSSSRRWPSYVAEEEPSIYHVSTIEPFTRTDFEGDVEEIIAHLRSDPRAVYRADDMQYRYDLTLRNARDMRKRYEEGDYSFRLMSAVQGWDCESYVNATKEVLDLGYQYLGIGGVAGSPESAVKDIVSAVGNEIKSFERTHETRIDTHVFGFAKSGAFETIGRSGMTSFDSASMLRAAWTGGQNYHLDSDERYDAIRVRYPSYRDDLQTSIEKALRGQEMLYALRAFDNNEPIADALQTWHNRATQALSEITEYLLEHRHDERYDVAYIKETEEAFRSGYDHGRAFRASFGDPLSSKLIKLLRDDDPENPIPFTEYDDLVAVAEKVFTDWTPTLLDVVVERESETPGTINALWPLVEAYATWDPISDANLLDDYRDLLNAKPWKRCDCPICTRNGIEVAIFRGNNRNRRRGFHNTRRFYDQFEGDLPKILVVTRPSASVMGQGTMERYLRNDRPTFWGSVHDLPVAEIGAVSATGLHEWWANRPETASFDSNGLADVLVTEGERYQDIFVDARHLELDEATRSRLEDVNCTVHEHTNPASIRDGVLERLGYEDEFLPQHLMQSGLTDY
ncbi:queuine tRNA-ribosyltransferase tRNA-guanine transglycosylase [Halomicroarcula limicola]|uniref:Queuine tRNA-ribosyltransferase tRNA-guanine transglycosylase n=1 Tax=Haloarcula limicola TaxID=1429915 RepID=A0A8J7YDZ5_9EURY|nr:queuine tRNA-ribosyltransferase tRNA-guanine transglycosylase [Halomicroarcula limicola]MBV0924758.1 queuine tRNA-ribosyltransferase tRNA-guanine transglycosylase [Halomicroarcula limicola]